LYDYGYIAPQKYYHGGQSTDVGMNKRVREGMRAGDTVAIFVRETTDYIGLEAEMIADLQPPWNVRGILKTT
jgi:hypothetical protein